MKKKIITFFLFLSCTFSFAFSHEKTPLRPLVITTISPYHIFIEKIAGDSLLVRNIIPKSKNPHAFEPSIKDMQTIKEATLWFYIGEAFEKKILSSMKKHNPNLVSYDLCAPLILSHNEQCNHHHETHEDLKDRHVWLSPKRVLKQVSFIEKILCEHFPENKHLFSENAKKLKEELSLIDSQIKELLSPLKGKTLVVSHPDFSYFCEDYDLRQLPIEKEGKDPSPCQLYYLLKEIKKEKVKIVFYQPQYNAQGAKVLAKKAKIPSQHIDPFSEDYFNNILNFTKSFSNHYQK